MALDNVAKPVVKKRKKISKEEKLAREEECKLRMLGYKPVHPVSNTYGSQSTAQYVADKYSDAIIVYHPEDPVWDSKTWRVWIKPYDTRI